MAFAYIAAGITFCWGFASPERNLQIQVSAVVLYLCPVQARFAVPASVLGRPLDIKHGNFLVSLFGTAPAGKRMVIRLGRKVWPSSIAPYGRGSEWDGRLCRWILPTHRSLHPALSYTAIDYSQTGARLALSRIFLQKTHEPSDKVSVR